MYCDVHEDIQKRLARLEGEVYILIAVNTAALVALALKVFAGI